MTQVFRKRSQVAGRCGEERFDDELSGSGKATGNSSGGANYYDAWPSFALQAETVISNGTENMILTLVKVRKGAREVLDVRCHQDVAQCSMAYPMILVALLEAGELPPLEKGMLLLKG